MAWTEEQISTYQIHNKQMLAEVNATLRPDENLSDTNKVGIFLPGQAGDLMTAMSVLQYRNQIFGNAKIIWYANQPNCDCLKYAPISEVRPWPWAGNGLPEGCPDFWPMLMNKEDNQLNNNLKYNFNLTKDLTDGYFPAPYMLEPQKRHGWDYPSCSKKVFKIPDDYEWHPLLNFSNEEANNAFDFIEKLPEGHRIFFETFAGSSQSVLSDEMVKDTLRICREKWPGCVFIFASHKYLRAQENFPDYFLANNNDIYSCSHFTVRQCALVADECKLIISVSSGLTVAASHWGAKPIPIIQYCGSWVCSTASLAKGRHFELVTADNKLPQVSQTEFYLRLESLLNQYK